MTPLKAIKAKCLECSCGQITEVKNCPIKDCSLWEYRTGHGQKKTLSDEDREMLRQRARQNFNREIIEEKENKQ